MKNHAVLLFLTVFAGFVFVKSANSQIPEFKYFEIGQTDELLGQTSLVDVDNDGDLDYIVGSGYGTIWWFEYQSEDTWVKHILGKNCLTDAGGVAFDVDGDGWVDQVSGQTWYRNTGDPKNEQFERYENKAIYAYDNIAADINGDGTLDLISMSDIDGLYWYDYSKDPFKKWKGREIGEGLKTGIAPLSVGDFDEDGDLDIARSNLWYENVKGDGKKWKMRRNLELTQLKGDNPNSTKTQAIDFDGDGDTDLVQVSSFYEDCSVLWLEKQDKRGLTWFAHWIETNTGQDLQSLCVADFDNDGDNDVFSGGGDMTKDFHKRCFIWENIDGKGLEWKKHEILIDHECVDAVCGDVDGDGDIDICSKPWKGKVNYYLKNMHIENGGKAKN